MQPHPSSASHLIIGRSVEVIPASNVDADAGRECVAPSAIAARRRHANRSAALSLRLILTGTRSLSTPFRLRCALFRSS